MPFEEIIPVYKMLVDLIWVACVLAAEVHFLLSIFLGFQ